MTEAERLERERDWVKARFDCTVDAVFEELIAVIEFDIRTFNKRVGQREATINHVEDGKVTFSRKERVSSVLIKGKTIKVSITHRNSQLSSFDIRPEWNEDSMDCDLIIDGEKVSMHRASQKVIGDVLFGYG